MDPKLKLFLGKILGEIYRTQQRMDIPTPVSKGTIFGLINGVETAIDDVFRSTGELITNDQHNALADLLEPFLSSKEKLASFNGYYDIEKEAEEAGVDRSTAITLLTYWSNNLQFREVIKKMDSSGSPGECRTFELDEFGE